MTRFMCNQLKWPDYSVWVIMAIPYTIRVVFNIAMFLIAFYNPIPGFQFFALWYCEAVSFLHDLFIVKYGELVLVKNKSQATVMDLIWEVVHPRNSSIIMLFSVGWIMGVVGDAMGNTVYSNH